MSFNKYRLLPKEALPYLHYIRDVLELLPGVTGAEINPRVGTVLIREWDEREHHVVVTPDGKCEYEGETFRSLSAVARHITGVQWNGPRFFGLRGQKAGVQ